eukprot:TRINITY_DN70695_c0_g1_i1.p1 TRINITY_DN70695_c0_g1~~TRINITY_DN70695_c0_g1_i1.p1  ORF type:complete len:411 (-),score=46.26 TRINITY_DN70695_c0_g1_i1:32-1207(-)
MAIRVYADRWIEINSEAWHDEPTYPTYRRRTCDRKTRDTIGSALRIEKSSILGTVEEGQLPLELHRHFRRSARAVYLLQRMLEALSVAIPELSYNPDFAQFSSAVFIVVGNERTSFRLLYLLYHQLSYVDYCGDAAKVSESLDADVRTTLGYLEQYWPLIIESYKHCDALPVLEKNIKRLLSTVLGSALAGETTLYGIAAILDWLITRASRPQKGVHPRSDLCWAVACVFACYGRQLELASSVGEHAMIKATAFLTHDLVVDEVLIGLLEASIDIQNAFALSALSMVPVGVAVGGLSGMFLSKQLALMPLVGLRNTVDVAVGVAATSAGACTAAVLAYFSGESQSVCAVRCIHDVLEEENGDSRNVMRRWDALRMSLPALHDDRENSHMGA